MPRFNTQEEASKYHAQYKAPPEKPLHKMSIEELFHAASVEGGIFYGNDKQPYYSGDKAKRREICQIIANKLIHGSPEDLAYYNNLKHNPQDRGNIATEYSMVDLLLIDKVKKLQDNVKELDTHYKKSKNTVMRDLIEPVMETLFKKDEPLTVLRKIKESLTLKEEGFSKIDNLKNTGEWGILNFLKESLSTLGFFHGEKFAKTAEENLDLRHESLYQNVQKERPKETPEESASQAESKSGDMRPGGLS